MKKEIAVKSASATREVYERESIITCLKNFFETMSSHYGVEMAFLYGSWAK
jgi:hypothetical protein